MLYLNSAVHRLTSPCAPLHQCLDYQNIASNMQESYSGPKKSRLEVTWNTCISFFLSFNTSNHIIWPSTCVHYYNKSWQPGSSSPLETSLDGDSPEHIQWVFDRAQERAAEFNITGVTYRLTQGEHVNSSFVQHICVIVCCNLTPRCFCAAGVVKRIIPAVASTNAVIAGRKLKCFF